MSGILVIAVVGAWLWFCVWLARKVASWMPNEQPRSKLRGIKHPNQKISRGKPRGIEPGEINDWINATTDEAVTFFSAYPTELLRSYEDPIPARSTTRVRSNPPTLL